ncbi:MAG: D-2-hydroxyacid dehydrogenase [Acidobacteriota bacterium]|nr:D-2-hydroxyacid dehydrogenase [Acidobacteriota bacterium]
MRTGLTVLVALAAGLWGAEHKKIVVMGLTPAAIRELGAVSPNVTVEAVDRTRSLEQLADADALFGGIDAAQFSAAKKLKWVQLYSAGVEHLRFPEFTNSNVTLTNCKIIQGPEIADHAFALLLALTRDLHQIIPQKSTENLAGNRYQPVELRGKTAVIVGVGGIGSQIAQRAHAFGMTVIGVDPKEMPLNPYVSRMVPPDRIDTVLPLADVVFISAPHTPQSEGMIGPRQFEEMKPGAYFIAVSRGKVYNTGALVKALDSRRLSGAGLDVTDPEPLPKGHALWKFENVIITPHIAGQSDGIDARRMVLLKDNILRFDRGEPLLNVVDKVKGY